MLETMNCDPTAIRRKVNRHVVVSRNDRAVQELDHVVEDGIDMKREMMLDQVVVVLQQDRAHGQVHDLVLGRERNQDLVSRRVASPPGKPTQVPHPVLRPALLPALPSARLRRGVVQQVARVKNRIRPDRILVAQNRSDVRF
ncbi:MAG: hypothetical protein RLY14_2679 [Planctomycetota bacterium]